MGQPFAALQDLTAALKVKPSAELLANRGVVHQVISYQYLLVFVIEIWNSDLFVKFMRDYPNAMQNYQAAIKQDPNYSLAYFNGANLYFRNRQFSQARDYYDQAIRFNKKDEGALLNRAICRV